MLASMTNGKAVLLIEAAKTRPELHWALEQITLGIGYQHFCFVMRITSDLSRPTFVTISNYSVEWQVYYVKNHLERIDPVAEAVQRKNSCVLWQDLREQSPDFFASADKFGLSHGISMPVPGLGTELNNINLGRATPLDLEEIRDTEFFLRNIAHYASEQLLRIIDSESAPNEQTADLSPREIECLRWVADGKTSWEIAAILEIAERTVIFHLQNAKAKLGASGRQHAAVKAAALGYLAHDFDPDIAEIQYSMEGSSPF